MKEVIDFFRRLHDNNDREWFDAHRAEWTRVKGLFAQKREESLVGNAAVERLFSEKNDINVAVSYGVLVQENPMLASLPMAGALEGVKALGSVNFEKGRIVADGTPREVFSQVELLRSEGLAVPATTQLIYELRRDGYDLPLSALTVSECADAVMSAI